MEGVCIRHTEFPASTPLFTDYLYAFERVRGFYSHPPEFDRVQTAAKSVPRDLSHRRRLVEALREQNRNGGPATERHLEALLDPETVAVATGQQVGLYGGPAFAVYKAATAIRLAAGLRDRGTPAVPVFWPPRITTNTRSITPGFSTPSTTPCGSKQASNRRRSSRSARS